MTNRASAAFGWMWRVCAAPGGKTVRQKQSSFEPAVSLLTSQRMSTPCQPASARTPAGGTSLTCLWKCFAVASSGMVDLLLSAVVSAEGPPGGGPSANILFVDFGYGSAYALMSGPEVEKFVNETRYSLPPTE